MALRNLASVALTRRGLGGTVAVVRGARKSRVRQQQRQHRELQLSYCGRRNVFTTSSGNEGVAEHLTVGGEGTQSASQQQPGDVHKKLHDDFVTSVAAGDAQLALQKFQAITSANSPMASSFRVRLIHLLCQQGQLEEASTLLGTALEDLPPLSRTSSALSASPLYTESIGAIGAGYIYVIDACIKTNHLAEALRNFRKAKDAGLCLDLPVCGDLAKAVLHARQADVKAMTEPELASVAAEALKLELWQVLFYIRTVGMVPSEELCEHLLLAASSHMDLQLALELLRYMTEAKVKPSLKAFNKVFDCVKRGLEARSRALKMSQEEAAMKASSVAVAEAGAGGPSSLVLTHKDAMLSEDLLAELEDVLSLLYKQYLESREHSAIHRKWLRQLLAVMKEEERSGSSWRGSKGVDYDGDGDGDGDEYNDDLEMPYADNGADDSDEDDDSSDDEYEDDDDDDDEEEDDEDDEDGDSFIHVEGGEDFGDEAAHRAFFRSEALDDRMRRTSGGASRSHFGHGAGRSSSSRSSRYPSSSSSSLSGPVYDLKITLAVDLESNEVVAATATTSASTLTSRYPPLTSTSHSVTASSRNNLSKSRKLLPKRGDGSFQTGEGGEGDGDDCDDNDDEEDYRLFWKEDDLFFDDITTYLRANGEFFSDEPMIHYPEIRPWGSASGNVGMSEAMAALTRQQQDLSIPPSRLSALTSATSLVTSKAKGSAATEAAAATTQPLSASSPSSSPSSTSSSKPRTSRKRPVSSGSIGDSTCGSWQSSENANIDSSSSGGGDGGGGGGGGSSGGSGADDLRKKD